jgi:hypothetical protein
MPLSLLVRCWFSRAALWRRRPFHLDIRHIIWDRPEAEPLIKPHRRIIGGGDPSPDRLPAWPASSTAPKIRRDEAESGEFRRFLFLKRNQKSTRFISARF